MNKSARISFANNIAALRRTIITLRRTLAAIAVVAVTALTVTADSFKILYLTTPTITIGGKVCKVGDVFPGDAAITWTAPRQAMKVLDTATKKQSLVVAEKYRGSKSADMNSYFVQSKQLSTRRGELINTMELGMVLAEQHYLLDSIAIPTSLPVDDSHFFFASYDYNGETINKKLTYRDGELIFDRSLYSIDGKAITPFDVVLSVWYMDRSAGNRTLVTDKMALLPVE